MDFIRDDHENLVLNVSTLLGIHVMTPWPPCRELSFDIWYIACSLVAHFLSPHDMVELDDVAWEHLGLFGYTIYWMVIINSSSLVWYMAHRMLWIQFLVASSFIFSLLMIWQFDNMAWDSTIWGNLGSFWIYGWLQCVQFPPLLHDMVHVAWSSCDP